MDNNECVWWTWQKQTTLLTSSVFVLWLTRFRAAFGGLCSPFGYEGNWISALMSYLPSSIPRCLQSEITSLNASKLNVPSRMPLKQNFRFWCLKSKLSFLDASKMNFPLRYLKKPFREETSSSRHPMGEGVFSGLVGIYLFRQLWGIQGKKFTLEAFMEGKAIIALQDLFLRYPGREIQLWGIQGGSSIKHTRRTFFIWGVQGGKFNYEASREESSFKHTRRPFSG